MDSSSLKILLGILLGAASAAQDSPTIGFISPDEQVDVGSEVEMSCQIKNGKTYPIIWMRLRPKGDDDKSGGGGGGGFSISLGPNLLISDDRLSLNHDDNDGTYTLKITNVTLSDAATYQCQVVVGLNDMITADVELRVKRAPSMTDLGSEPSVRARMGQEAVIECVARGVPNPRFVWTRADGRLMYNGRPKVHTHKLTIKNVKKEDRGQYVCTAENGVGEPVNRKITLEVEFPPTITVPKPRVPQAEHFDAEVACNILAFPSPSIFWRRNNKTVTNSGNYKIHHFASQGELITSTLKISETRPDQFGNYTCEARNRHGSANQTVELYKSKIAICPPVCGDVDLTNGSEGKIKTAASSIVLSSVLSLLLARGL